METEKIDAENCALRKNFSCVYSSPQTPLTVALDVCPAKCEKKLRRGGKFVEKIFYYCCGLLQAHHQRLHLQRMSKTPRTMNVHRFFRGLLFRFSSQTKFRKWFFKSDQFFFLISNAFYNIYVC